MASRNRNQRNRELLSLCAAFGLGLAFLVVGNLILSRVIEGKVLPAAKKTSGEEDLRPCPPGLRLAGFGPSRCKETIQLHPMKFR